MPAPFETIRYEVDGPVAYVTLDRPDAIPAPGPDAPPPAPEPEHPTETTARPPTTAVRRPTRPPPARATSST